jgi:hypothetical protein
MLRVSLLAQIGSRWAMLDARIGALETETPPPR